MTKNTGSAQDQKEPQRLSRSSPQAKMVLIKKENKKPARKPSRQKTAKNPTVTFVEPVVINRDSTTSDVDARIAERAYELYKHRGGHHGQDLEDWLAAERAVQSEECCS